MNRRGATPLFILTSVLLVALLFFIIIQIHFSGKFAGTEFVFDPFIRIRSTVNYGLLVTSWIVIQGLLVFGYIKVGLSLKKLYALIKKYLFNISMKVESFILSHN